MIIGMDVPKYLPDIKYFWKLAQCDAWVFLDKTQVKRSPLQDFQRANIKTPTGRMVLTVPIQRVGNPLKDVRIVSGNWQAQHWSCIEKAYAGCKYHHFRDMFKGFLLAKRWENLANLNIKGIKFVCKMLQIKTKLFRESVHGKDYPDAIEFVEPSFKHRVYPQQHGKWTPELSIVDFLCNTGGEGKYDIVEFFSAN